MRSKKGGAVRMPSEYFGHDSGRYTDNLQAGLDKSVYGETNPVSFGTLNPDNTTGPNLGVHPNASNTQTGGAIRLPSEYYGQDSGRYLENVPAVDKNAYGETNAVSFGTINPDNTTGPNLGVHPNNSGLQTGGRKRRKNRKRSVRKGKVKRKRNTVRRNRKSSNKRGKNSSNRCNGCNKTKRNRRRRRKRN